MDIAEFLTARLDEDAKRWQRIWRAFQGDKRIDGGWDGWGQLGRLVSACVDTTRGGREVAAKRRHLETWREINADLRRRLEVIHAAPEDQLVRANIDYYEALGMQSVTYDLLMLDAGIYADHPDYAEAKRFGLSTLTKEARDA